MNKKWIHEFRPMVREKMTPRTFLISFFFQILVFLFSYITFFFSHTIMLIIDINCQKIDESPYY